MILGIGTDIVDIVRIKRMLERHSESFVRRVLSVEEQELLFKRKDKCQFCAGRWAIKEAFSKALGTGIGKACAMHEVSVVNDKFGRPVVVLKGKALSTFEELGGKLIHVSISHEKSYACASVVLEK